MSIKKTSNGKYRVDMLNEQNKRVQRTFLKKTDAEAFSAAIIRNKYNQKLIKNELLSARYPILSALEEYELSKKILKPNSVKKYGAIISFIREFVQANNITYIDEFTSSVADKYYNLLIKERIVDMGNFKKNLKAKPRTVNFYLMTIREFFKREILKDHIQKNPFIHIKNLKVEKQRPEYYTKEEISAFFAQPMKPEYYNAFKAFLLSGMRFEELANTLKKDIDLNERLIFVRNKEGFRTKTENSVREIPMSDELYKIVSKLIRNKEEDEYVFTGPGGNKLKERSLLEVCQRIARKARITRRATIHLWRHTFASMLVHEDIPIETISKLLGHSSVVETQIYAHNKTNHRHHQVMVLDKLFK